jgi:uncharacterized protein YjiS (DUF1127 family)
MAAPAFDHPALSARTLAALSPVPAVLMAVAVTLATWELRARTRADLRAMDPARYPDLGLSTAEVLHEVAKPFWRA